MKKEMGQASAFVFCVIACPTKTDVVFQHGDTRSAMLGTRLSCPSGYSKDMFYAYFLMHAQSLATHHTLPGSGNTKTTLMICHVTSGGSGRVASQSRAGLWPE